MDLLTFISEHPEIVVTVLSGFLLPIILVWLNNRYNLKTKEKEQEITREFKFTDEQVSHEKIIHSSLVKILFEIQKLYISLSCDPEKEKDCIVDASKEFQSCFAKYQGIISDNQIFLESQVVNELYKFYNTIGEILVELNQIRQNDDQEIARICVYDRSQELADIILNIQEIFVGKRQNLFGDLKVIREEMKEFKTCCGPPPPGELRDRYDKVMKELNKLPEPVELKK
ncbi:hypothetical protein GCM10009122_49200 [Fulvivirga kasyanovii]|uniref:hypothetical protein n=1 Tax=Fulvivirga kasyanovii TaxID=396812 RepID=UPI0031E04819